MTKRSEMFGSDLEERSSAPLNEGHRNEVLLVGRLAGEVQQRVMPSGALLCSFRLVVRRESPAHSGPSIDTLECVAWRAPVQQVIDRWSAGDLVEVRGALRRRFWRGASGSVSRCEIEVCVVRRLARGVGRTSVGRRTYRSVDPKADLMVDQRAGPLVAAGVSTA